MDLDGRLSELARRRVDRLPRDVVFPRGESAVLLLVVVSDADPGLVLTRRSGALRTDPGFIALPGGRCETGESVADTACRETSEEIGLAREVITVHGRFDDAWSSAGFRVTPIVGTVVGPLTFAPSEEVTETRVVDLAHLGDPARRRRVVKEIDGHEYEDVAIDVDGWEVYGLTADLVLDLTTWLQGSDRRRVAARRADLAHFAPRRW